MNRHPTDTHNFASMMIRQRQETEDHGPQHPPYDAYRLIAVATIFYLLVFLLLP